jgi:carboxylesterase
MTTVPVVPGAEAFSSEGGRVGVLLVHGFTGSPASLRPWGEYLAEQGLTVSCPRLPGHGTRWQDMNLTRWEDWYAEADRAFESLRRQVDHVFVMGLSMGGTLTLRLAEQHPGEITGLVLVNPSLLTQNPMAKLAPALKYVVPSTKGLSNDIKKPGQDEIAYDRVPVKAFVSLVQMWALVRADLGKVDLPILLFRSEIDHVVEPASAAELKGKVGSKDVREVVLHDSYHVATLDNDAPAIFAGSLEFVRELAPIEA